MANLNNLNTTGLPRNFSIYGSKIYKQNFKFYCIVNLHCKLSGYANRVPKL